MGDNNWGISSTGFKRPSYQDILLQLEIKARELFGDKAQLHPQTFLGQFLRILAWITDRVFQLTEIVYNSGAIFIQSRSYDGAKKIVCG